MPTTDIEKELKGLSSRIDRLVGLLEGVFRESGGSTARIAAGSKSFSGSRSRKREDLDFDELETSIKDLAKQLGESEESFKDIDSLTKLIHKRFSGLEKGTEQSAQAFRILNALVKNSASTLEDLEEGAEDASANIWRFASSLDHNTLASKQFSSNLAKSIVNTAVFNSALFANSDVLKENTRMYDSATKGVRDAAKKLNAGILSAVDVYDEVTGELKSSLMIKDFARLNLSVANISATIDDAAQKLELKNGISELLNYSGNRGMLSNALAGDSDFKAGLDALVAKMRAAGVDLSHHFEDASDETANYANAIEEIVAIHKNNAVVLEEFAAVATQAGTVLGGLTMKVQNASSAFNDWVDANIRSSDAIRQNAEQFGSSLLRIFDQADMFNMAMIPDTFMNVQRAAIEMGLSFEEAVQFLQNSDIKRLYAMYGGAGGFTGSATSPGALDRMMQMYKDENFTQQQGAQLMAANAPVANASFVNMRDEGQFTNFLQQTAVQFKRLSAITGMTVEEIAALNGAVYNAEVMQSRMIGLSEEEANQFRKTTFQQIEYYKSLGLSTEAVQEAILLAQREQRQKAGERFAGAARMMILAQQSGMSGADMAELQRLEFKKFRTDKEEQALARLRTQARVGNEQQMQNLRAMSLAAEQRGDLAAAAQFQAQADSKEQILGTTVEALDAERRDAYMGIAGEIARGEATGRALGDEEKENVIKAAAPDGIIAESRDWFNSIKAAIDSSFVAAITSASMALWGLTASATAAAGSNLLGMLGGGGGGGGRGGRGGRILAGAGRAKDALLGAGSRAGGAIGRVAGSAGTWARSAAGALGNTASAVGGRAAALLGPAAAVAGSGLAGWQIGTWLNEAMEGTSIGNAKDAAFDSMFSGIDNLTGGMISGDAGIAAENWKNSALGKWINGEESAATAAVPAALATRAIAGTPAADVPRSVASTAANISDVATTAATAAGAAATVNTLEAGIAQAVAEPGAILNPQGVPGLDPTVKALVDMLAPEKLSEAFANALSGVRITLYNPNSATTSLGYISGRQSS